MRALHDAGPRTPAPAAARRPAARPAALRLPAAGRLRVRRRPGGARRALSRPVRRLAACPTSTSRCSLLVGVVVAVYVRFGRYHSLDRLLVGDARAVRCVRPAVRRCSPGARRRGGCSRSSTCGSGCSASSRRRRCGRSRTGCSRPARRAGCSGCVGAGATLGATLAGVACKALAKRYGAESLLVLVAALLLVAPLARRAPVEGAAGARGDAVGAARRAGQGEPARQPAPRPRVQAPAGDRRDRAALVLRDRALRLADEGDRAAVARPARTPSRPSSAASTPGSAASAS